ncbi:unnamed protein product [Durusdinium trenchii]|uniref:Uncharacterized protein n=1 Tax=Durusdinium trenchii TaxID=1381693 RepID=A0ABP0SAB3_9DINO
MSGLMARRRRSSREGGRLRDPGDQGGQLRVGAADERREDLRRRQAELKEDNKDRCRWDLRLLKDFLDLYFMAAIQDTLALMIRDNLEGKGLGSGRQRHRLSFQFRRKRTGELEAIRERILREAHLNFEKEVKKLTSGGGSSTFESANSVGERAKLRGSTDGQSGNSGDGVGESKPQVEVDPAFQRIEQRGIAMLLEHYLISFEAALKKRNSSRI